MFHTMRKPRSSIIRQSAEMETHGKRKKSQLGTDGKQERPQLGFSRTVEHFGSGHFLQLYYLLID